MPRSGSSPVLGRLLDLPLEHRPQRLRQLLARVGVQVDRVQHGTPHVVLALVVRAVADPHRPRALVAGQVRRGPTPRALLAADAVHDLQVVPVAGRRRG